MRKLRGSAKPKTTPSPTAMAGVAGKIEVKLQGVGERAEPGFKGRRGTGLVKYRRDHAREGIGKEKLLEPSRSQRFAFLPTRGQGCGSACLSSRAIVLVPHDRTRDELREECDVQRDFR